VNLWEEYIITCDIYLGLRFSLNFFYVSFICMRNIFSFFTIIICVFLYWIMTWKLKKRHKCAIKFNIFIFIECDIKANIN